MEIASKYLLLSMVFLISFRVGVLSRWENPPPPPPLAYTIPGISRQSTIMIRFMPFLLGFRLIFFRVERYCRHKRKEPRGRRFPGLGGSCVAASSGALNTSYVVPILFIQLLKSDCLRYV
jgi:hypothetical protein